MAVPDVTGVDRTMVGLYSNTFAKISIITFIFIEITTVVHASSAGQLTKSQIHSDIPNITHKLENDATNSSIPTSASKSSDITVLGTASSFVPQTDKNSPTFDPATVSQQADSENNEVPNTQSTHPANGAQHFSTRSLGSAVVLQSFLADPFSRSPKNNPTVVSPPSSTDPVSGLANKTSKGAPTDIVKMANLTNSEDVPGIVAQTDEKSSSKNIVDGTKQLANKGGLFEDFADKNVNVHHEDNGGVGAIKSAASAVLFSSGKSNNDTEIFESYQTGKGKMSVKSTAAEKDIIIANKGRQANGRNKVNTSRPNIGPIGTSETASNGVTVGGGLKRKNARNGVDRSNGFGKMSRFIGRRSDWRKTKTLPQKGKVSNTTTPDQQKEVTCYCNLGNCAAKGYICRSATGICYIKRYYSADGSPEGYKLRHIYGCYELLENELQDRCTALSKNSSTDAQSYSEDASFDADYRRGSGKSAATFDEHLSKKPDVPPLQKLPQEDGASEVPSDGNDVMLACCTEDVCNYERPNTVYIHTHYNTKGLRGALYSRDRSEVKRGSLFGDPLTGDRSTLFTMAAILVPVGGAILLFTVIFLAVRLLSIDSERSNYGPRYHYHKAPVCDPSTQYQNQLSQQQEQSRDPLSIRRPENLLLQQCAAPSTGQENQGNQQPPPYTIHQNFSNKASQTSPLIAEKLPYHTQNQVMNSSSSSSVAFTPTDSFHHYLKALDEHHQQHHHLHIHHTIEAYQKDFQKLFPNSTIVSSLTNSPRRKSPRRQPLSSFRGANQPSLNLQRIRKQEPYPKDSLAGYLLPICPRTEYRYDKVPTQPTLVTPTTTKTKKSTRERFMRSKARKFNTMGTDSPASPSTPSYTSPSRSSCPSPVVGELLLPQQEDVHCNLPSYSSHNYSPSKGSTQSSMSPSKSDYGNELQGKSFVEVLMSLTRRANNDLNVNDVC